MENQRFERTRMLIGDEGLARLASSRVAVFGLGGVGGAAAEALARAGVGRLTIVDFDKFAPSNLNRQLFALNSTLGMPKAEAAKARLADVNPACEVTALDKFLGPENSAEFELGSYDYVVDCIDTLKGKAELIRACVEAGTPVALSAGAGAKSDPTGVRVVDLFSIHGCPLSAQLRKRLRRVGVTGPLPTAWSPAPRLPTLGEPPDAPTGKHPVGSISYVPPIFGYVLAGFVVRHLLGDPLLAGAGARQCLDKS